MTIETYAEYVAREAEEMAKIEAVFSNPAYLAEREAKRDPMTIPIGEIPLSPALAEADPESISELFNRNPEDIMDIRAKIERLVESMRAQRARCEAAEGAGKPVPRQKKAKLASPVNPDDLGI